MADAASTAEPATQGGSEGAPGKTYTEADVQGLLRKRDELLEETKRAKEKLRALDGLDPEEYRRLKDEAIKREQSEAERKGEWDKLRSKLQEEHAKVAQALGAERDKYKTMLQRQAVRAEAARVLAALKGDPDLLMPHIEAAVEVVEDGDALAIRIREKGGAGHRYGSKGEFMSLEEYAKGELLERFPRAFDGLNNGGSGAAGNVARVSGKPDISNLPPSERLSRAFGTAA